MKKVSKLRSILYAGAMLGAAIPSASHAGAVISFVQQASGVVATGSGSVDLTGLTPSFSGNDGFTAVSGHDAYAVLGPTAPAFDSVTFELGVTGPANFGTGTYFAASSGSGDRFGIDAANYSGPGSARLWISPTYKNGSALSSTDSWSGATFASLGLTPGVYTYSWGTGPDADTLQVRIGQAPIGGAPEPAAWAMMMIGLGAMGWVARWRARPVGAAL